MGNNRRKKRKAIAEMVARTDELLDHLKEEREWRKFVRLIGLGIIKAEQ